MSVLYPNLTKLNLFKWKLLFKAKNTIRGGGEKEMGKIDLCVL